MERKRALTEGIENIWGGNIFDATFLTNLVTKIGVGICVQMFKLKKSR